MTGGLIDGVNARLDYLESKVTVRGVKRLEAVEVRCGTLQMRLDAVISECAAAAALNAQLAGRIEKLERQVAAQRRGRRVGEKRR